MSTVTSCQTCLEHGEAECYRRRLERETAKVVYYQCRPPEFVEIDMESLKAPQ